MLYVGVFTYFYLSFSFKFNFIVHNLFRLNTLEEITAIMMWNKELYIYQKWK